jgi:hypothetical protein
LIRYDSGLTLLSRRNAPKVISFLYQIFKEQGRTTIEQAHLQQLLAAYLQSNEDLAAEEEQGSEAIIELDYEDKARNLLLSWSNERNGFLLRYYDEEAVETIELSAGLERLFRFLEEVMDSKRLFVGTESRFAQIMEGFRELDVNTIDNPRARIDELNKQKERIQQQIDEIERTGTAATFDGQKIAERLYNLERTAKGLLSDFRQLKDNNHAIFSELCHKQIQATESRGALLAFTLEKSEELENSPQGKSFESFWNYLCSTDEEDTIRAKANALRSRIKGQPFDYPFFASLEEHLIDAGREIIEENRLLSDRLKRAITRYNSKEYRLMKETMDAIKGLAIENPPCGMENMMQATGSPALFGGMQRYPVLPETDRTPRTGSYENADDPLEIDLKALFDDVAIDESLLMEHIRFDREHVRDLTLKTVLVRHPVRSGLAEIVAYLTLLSKQDWAVFDDEQRETVTYTDTYDGSTVSLSIPKVVINGNDE